MIFAVIFSEIVSFASAYFNELCNFFFRKISDSVKKQKKTSKFIKKTKFLEMLMEIQRKSKLFYYFLVVVPLPCYLIFRFSQAHFLTFFFIFSNILEKMTLERKTKGGPPLKMRFGRRFLTICVCFSKKKNRFREQIREPIKV